MPTVTCKCGTQFVHLGVYGNPVRCPSCGEMTGTVLPTIAQICANQPAMDCEVVKVDAGLAFASLASCVSQAFAYMDEGNIKKCIASLTEAMGVIERSTHPVVLMRHSGEVNVMASELPVADKNPPLPVTEKFDWKGKEPDVDSDLPLTDRARKIMQLANHAASALDHDFIATEHILIGLVKASMAQDGGVAGSVLSKEMDLRIILGSANGMMVRGTAPLPLGKRPLANEAKRLMSLAAEQAKSLGHGYIGTEHLLLAILAFDCAARTAMTSIGIIPQTVRAEILATLGHTPESKCDDRRANDNPAPIGEQAMRYLMNDLAFREVLDGWLRERSLVFLWGHEIGKPLTGKEMYYYAERGMRDAIRFALSDRKLWGRIKAWQHIQPASSSAGGIPESAVSQ